MHLKSHSRKSISTVIQIKLGTREVDETAQSNSTSCSRHQMGKEYTHFGRHKIKQQEQKA